MRNGTPWGYAWQLDGKEVSGESKLSWKFGPSGVLDLYLKSKSGLPEGSYNLQIQLQNKVVQEGKFVIGSAKPVDTPQKPSKNQSQGVTITGAVIDSSTRRRIQGAAVVFLVPGSTVDDFDSDKSKGKADTVLSYGVTNSSGIFTIQTPLPRDQSYSVIVGAKGYSRIAEDDALTIELTDPDLVELDPIELDRL